MSERHIWTAHRADTDEALSPPYYVASAAYKVAQREADRLDAEIIVKRDGRPYRIFRKEQ